MQCVTSRNPIEQGRDEQQPNELEVKNYVMLCTWESGKCFAHVIPSPIHIKSVKGLLAHFTIEQGRAQKNPDACLLYHRDNEC